MNKTIKSFEDLYLAAVDPSSFISQFLLGHLMIEFLLVKLIEINHPKLLKFAEKLNHFRLIELNIGMNHITKGQGDVLYEINKYRNKIAHNIGFSMTVDELRTLFVLAKENFVDLTDGLQQGIDELEDKSSIDECEVYIFSELFTQIAYDLHAIYEEFGGDVSDFN